MLPKAVETFRFPSIYDDYDFCTRYGISRRAVPYFSFKEVSLVGLANFEDRLRYLDRCEELAAISNAPDLRSPTQEIIEAFEKEREALGLADCTDKVVTIAATPGATPGATPDITIPAVMEEVKVDVIPTTDSAKVSQKSRSKTSRANDFVTLYVDSSAAAHRRQSNSYGFIFFIPPTE